MQCYIFCAWLVKVVHYWGVSFCDFRLTAFVISSFKHASEYITVDNTQLANSLNWLSRQMDTSGKCSEPEGGRVIHADMQGGTGEGVGLSAYCAMTFLENKDMPVSECRQWDSDGQYSLIIMLTGAHFSLAIDLNNPVIPQCFPFPSWSHCLPLMNDQTVL